VAAVFALLFAASMSGIVQGGALDPPGAPAPTMKSLDDVPPAWNQQLSAVGGCSSPRFDCVLNDTAVLDRETGLVWERDPAATTANWTTSIEACQDLLLGFGVGNVRYGQRLPSTEEFQSLFDLSTDALPDGHPFTVVAVDISPQYWTSTTVAGTATSAWVVQPLAPGATSGDKRTALRHWCVRGGAGLDGR
jgi:hypothetical protein